MKEATVPINGLRDALEQDIAKSLDMDGHVAKLEKLRLLFGHSIEALQFDEPPQECNCVMHALDFRMEHPTTPLGRFFANTLYLGWLIERDVLTLIEGEPMAGSLAVYYVGGKVEHVGVVQSSGRIVSKWGIGMLCEHEPFEVPSSYGSKIRYFVAIDPDTAWELLAAFHNWRR